MKPWLEDGWHPEKNCECERQDLVYVGGDGYYLHNMCNICRRRIVARFVEADE